MKAVCRIVDPRAKVVRTNKSEGVETKAKVIVAKVTFEGSEELMRYLFECADEPMVVTLAPSQRDFVRDKAGDVDAAGDGADAKLPLPSVPKPRRRARASTRPNA